MSNVIVKKKTKYYFCIYCKNKVLKLARHLERNHQTEEKVKQFLALPKKNPERLNIIKKIRNEGSFYYNTTIDDNEIIVNRLPQHNSKNKDISDYLPCPHCQGFYKKFAIRKHLKKCGVNLGRQIQSTCKSLISNRQSSTYSKILYTSILPKLKNDIVTEHIRQDDLILSFGNLLCRKYATKEHLDKHIRNKLRMLARFVITAKEICPAIVDLKTCIDPLHFDTIIIAINKLSGYNTETRNYARPSLASIVGTTIKQCAQKVIANAIRSDDILKDKARHFIELYDIEYGPLIAATAVENITQSKWNKSIVLPSVADIKILNNYLDTKSEEYFQDLKINGFNINSWIGLMNHVLIKIMVFNRRRTGEIERLLIENYNQKQKIEHNSDTYKTLLSEEQILSQEFYRIEIRGKLGRRVPVLIRQKHVDYIDMILSLRGEAYVSAKNPYVFGRKNFHISACKELRSIASNCGASNPELLRGTFLRKQIATISQTMNLSENDVQIVADFLGHDIAIHKKHYRTPDLALQTGKVSKLLIAAEDPNLNKYRGKNLDNLEVNLDNNVTELAASQLRQSSSESYFKYKETNESKTKQRENLDSMKVDLESHGVENSSESEETNKSDTKLKIVRRTWNTPEKHAMRKLFCEHLKTGTLPTIAECIDANGERDLKYRTPDQIKAWVYNQIQQQRRKKTNAKKSDIILRQTWRTPEKQVMRKHFLKNLETSTLPSIKDCMEVLKNEHILKSRTPDQIKAWVNNDIKRRSRCDK